MGRFPALVARRKPDLAPNGTGQTHTVFMRRGRADIDDLHAPAFYRRMFIPVVLLALWFALILAPGFLAGPPALKRLNRLKEIDDGAAETYFEERRDLEAYRPSRRYLQLWRLLGATIAISAVSALIA